MIPTVQYNYVTFFFFFQSIPALSDGLPCKESLYIYEYYGTWSVTLYIVLKYASFIY